MFDFVQKNKRILQVFLGLIAITFATWGIESYTRFTGGRDTVASVNGSDNSQREFRAQAQAQQEQGRRLFGGRADPRAVDKPQQRPPGPRPRGAQGPVAPPAPEGQLLL